MDEIRCACCGEIISEEDEGHTLNDGSVVCDDCFDTEYGTCDLCGEVFPADELTFWGESQICPDCRREECGASGDEDDDEDEELEEAYEEMLDRLLGRRTEGLHEGDNGLQYTINGRETDHTYYLTVTVDENGVITDVSRLTQEMLMSESTTSSNWEERSVDPEDYVDIVDLMLWDHLIDEDDEDDEDEDKG